MQLPLWLVVVAAILGTFALLDRILAPSVRWFLRRRMERFVFRLNQRLDRPIEPFKLMQRQDMILRLSYDPKLIQAVVDHAREQGIPEDVAFEEARTYVREIVPAFSASAYFGFAIQAARWLSRSLFTVRLGHYDPVELSKISADATVIFVMNHRSNMDYVLVTYLAAGRTALSYAVGEWAQVWPLRGLIRAMGAYFIRRKSGSPLYRRVLARYVQMATEQGVTQAVFPEGGLSLDGRMAEPKLGILSYVVSDFQPGIGRDVVFVPVALNYDRVLEDDMLIHAARIGERKFRAPMTIVLGAVTKFALAKLTGRFRRFGFAAVSFGAPVSLGVFMATGHDNATEGLAALLMSRIKALVPVLPVPLVAAALVAGRTNLLSDLETEVADLLSRLTEAGAQLNLPAGGVRSAVSAGLAAMEARGLIRRNGQNLIVAAGKEDHLRFYANSIAHLLERA